MTSAPMDFISQMPRPILLSILERLSTTEEVVRTSVLSTDWKDLWTSIPSIDLDISRASSNKFSMYLSASFLKFVTRALGSSILDLVTFRLECGNYYNMATVGDWIHAAVSRKVKVLDLTFCPKDKVEVKLPQCLITCNSLESLKLCLFASTLSLSDVSLSTVKVIELNHVELIDEVSVESFFKNCSVLEELNLFDCLLDDLTSLCISSESLKIIRIDNRNLDNMNYYDNQGLCTSLEVCCPQLVHFEYGGHIADHFSLSMESLKVAAIHPEEGDNIYDLFAAISHVESLSISLDFLQAIDDADDLLEHFPTSLSNLKTLEISTTMDDYTMKGVMWILRCSLNLKSLCLTILKDIFLPQCWELDVVLTNHLTRVEFIDFNGEERKLAMACFILENANELNEMVFIWHNKVKYDEKSMETMNLVSRSNKASSTVEVFTLLKE